MRDPNGPSLETLEDALVLFEPARYIRKLVASTTDIYRNRGLLKQIPYNKQIIGHLAKLILHDLEEGRRFRVFDCLRVLRSNIVASYFDRPLPEPTVNDLFAIYRALILTAREEAQWCLSRILRGQILSPEAVHWLLEHWNESDHIVNRLLRYPVPSPPIQQWAIDCYRKNRLPDRKSEILALLIGKDIPDFLQHEPPDELAWGVFYSRLSKARKVQLIAALVDRMTSPVLLDVAKRLSSAALLRAGIRSMKAKIRNSV
jgi:hypothetical protein